MSQRFRFILFIRFLGYLAFFAGLISFVFMLGPLIQVEFNYRLDKARGVKRAVAAPVVPDAPAVTPAPAENQAGFGNVQTQENSIIPVSTQYGIVIEKINANARIIAGVNPGSEKEYSKALTQGVAEALGSTPPGQPGNLYLFSHSTDAPWNIVRYNAIFYLLRELEVGDRVIIFYNDKRYDYIVFDKVIAKPGDVSYLTDRYEFPVLTLQTCDPPGTLLNRLVIRARLVNS